MQFPFIEWHSVKVERSFRFTELHSVDKRRWGQAQLCSIHPGHPFVRRQVGQSPGQERENRRQVGELPRQVSELPMHRAGGGAAIDSTLGQVEGCSREFETLASGHGEGTLGDLAGLRRLLDHCDRILALRRVGKGLLRGNIIPRPPNWRVPLFSAYDDGAGNVFPDDSAGAGTGSTQLRS
jgi:hypothetical protein